MSGKSARKIAVAKRRRTSFAMDVDDDADMQRQQQGNMGIAAPGAGMSAATAAVQPQIPGPLGQMFGVPQAAAPVNVPNTYAGQFLSHSAGVVSSHQKPTLFHPASLQSVPSATEIITMKDENGIMRSYPVDQPTSNYVRSILSGHAATSQALATSATPATQMVVPPAASFGSLPSASSLYSSSSSVGSQLSQASSFSTTPGRKPAETLKILYSMLDEAKTPDDISAVKVWIQQTLYDMEEEAKWRQHLSGEVSHEEKEHVSVNGHFRNSNDLGDELVTTESNIIHSETSSANCNQGHFVSKPKKGFITRFNSVVSRLFQSKL